jgi:UDP-N-acetylglucosamine 2-epimerase (non-hydrolysing)
LAALQVLVVAGARPNFMKVAPLLAELRRHPDRFGAQLVHTGQHYDARMSDVFFADLELPEPDRYLGAVSQGPVAQTADIMAKFEPVVTEVRPDLVVVVGDVTSTVACALTASKLEVALAHVEAGLRSRDRGMPEELNRLVTDALADLLFTYSEDADANLLAEGAPAACIHRVGNLMIDSLLRCRSRAAHSAILTQLGLSVKGYALATLHRPANVDDPQTLEGILSAFDRIQQRLPLVFQVHPRTRKNIERFGLGSRLAAMPRLQLLEPVGYLDFLRLQEAARLVLVDSGGIQEETTVLGVPCLTLRDNTERPITVTQGTNRLVGCRPDRIVAEAMRVLDEGIPPGRVPPLWDGRAAERLVEVLRGGIRRR